MTVVALFPGAAPLEDMRRELQKAGVEDGAVEILSPIPPAQPARSPGLPLYAITIAAGFIGILVGVFFAGGTAALYPIMTGGKAIVARPVVGIIAYETMMLVAIVTTFLVMLIRIYRAKPVPSESAERVQEGAVGLAVTLTEDDPRWPWLQRRLSEFGAK
jgi:hypothetical protein